MDTKKLIPEQSTIHLFKNSKGDVIIDPVYMLNLAVSLRDDLLTDVKNKNLIEIRKLLVVMINGATGKIQYEDMRRNCEGACHTLPATIEYNRKMLKQTIAVNREIGKILRGSTTLKDSQHH